MRDYVAENWRACLEQNGLRSFDDFWNLDARSVEERNERRGGWSGVVRHELTQPSGKKVAVFIKRQENHVRRTWRHPIRGMLTLELEFKNILRYHENQIPTLTPVFYAQRLSGGAWRAVLVTEELSGFRSLADFVSEWNRAGWPPRETRRKVIEVVADLLCSIHRHHLRHDCFFPKHILLRPGASSGGWEARVIDLEKTRWSPWTRPECSRDLRNLASGSFDWPASDCVRFFKEYLGVKKLSPIHKASWAKLSRRVSAKRSHRAQKRAGRIG